VVVRHCWLGLDYLAAISYRLDFIALSGLEAYTRFEPVMCSGAKDRNLAASHKG